MTPVFQIPAADAAEVSRKTRIEIIATNAAQSSQQTVISHSDTVSTPAPMDVKLEAATSDRGTFVDRSIPEWSPQIETRFARLAARIAAKNATATEASEFKRLQSIRRRLHLVRPGEEVLRDFERRQRTHALVEALKRYVELPKDQTPTNG